MYCSLNLGSNVAGVIKEEQSRHNIQKYHQFGDIVALRVTNVEKRKNQLRVFCVFVREDQSYFHQPKDDIFQSKLNLSAAEFKLPCAKEPEKKNKFQTSHLVLNKTSFDQLIQ